MSSSISLKNAVVCSLAAAVSIASQGAFAHTRLQTSTVNSGDNLYNNVAITHGCHNATTGATDVPVIATTVVFPDDTATVQTRTPAVGTTPAGAWTNATETLDVFVEGGAVVNPAKVLSKDVFAKEDVKRDDLGNTIGFYGKDGSLPGLNYVGLVPFRPGAIFVIEGSCAKSVQYVVSIADICKVTKANAFTADVVNFWTPTVGSIFDGKPTDHAYNSPATYTIKRTTPLPAECGDGVEVRLLPTGAQLNKDMPIKYKEGNQIKQYWPKL